MFIQGTQWSPLHAHSDHPDSIQFLSSLQSLEHITASSWYQRRPEMWSPPSSIFTEIPSILFASGQCPSYTYVVSPAPSLTSSNNDQPQRKETHTWEGMHFYGKRFQMGEELLPGGVQWYSNLRIVWKHCNWQTGVGVRLLLHIVCCCHFHKNFRQHFSWFRQAKYWSSYFLQAFRHVLFGEAGMDSKTLLGSCHNRIWTGHLGKHSHINFYAAVVIIGIERYNLKTSPTNIKSIGYGVKTISVQIWLFHCGFSSSSKVTSIFWLTMGVVTEPTS